MKLILNCLTVCVTLVCADYWSDRETLLQQEKSFQIGSNIILNKKEERVNNILMNHKLRDFDNGVAQPQNYLPAQHFFKSKAAIEESEVFQIIRQLPKGASLHSHDTGMASQEFLYNITLKDNLYACIDEGDKLHLRFFNPEKIDKSCNWSLLSILREENSTFDEYLRSKLTLIVDNPNEIYTDINVVWSKFNDIFGLVGPLVGYRPVFEEYFYQCLKELYEDNVLYLEFRGVLPEVYDLDGRIYTPVEIAGIYVNILKKFKKDYRNFYGAKFIYAPPRRVNNDTVNNYMQILNDLQLNYPDFIAGFDLVGQEDVGEPLISFIPKLLEIQNKTKFFFHAGETNWNGGTDLNMVDAALLNTTRIGHGYAVLKHPIVQKIVTEQHIALEISPISNQVLKLVDDTRNHPGSVLIAQGYPVVICCDDPTFWGAKGLSYDWYMAFMGLASRDGDLKLLKQLAINSLIYSSVDNKDDIMRKWEKQWEKFLDNILLPKCQQDMCSNSVNDMYLQ